MTIRNFLIEYDAINSRNTFTNGDTINGRIILETDKETKIQSLIFKAEGKARACWTEHYGNNRSDIYWFDEKYYSIKQNILKEARQDGSVIIGTGRHVFPFSFKIPNRVMPSSFWSVFGRIIHKLKAELKQSMKLKRKAKIYFTFVCKADMNIPRLMSPQHDNNNKTIAFGLGQVTMDVLIRKMGYKPGEAINVRVEVNNLSKCPVQPKFILYERKRFSGGGKRRVETHEVLKDEAESVASYSGKKTVTKFITVPEDITPSILNCSLVRLEYKLKIYLNIKCTADPEITFPIIILPEVPDMTYLPPSYYECDLQAFENPNQPTSQVIELPPSYETSRMYPSFSSDEYQTAL